MGIRLLIAAGESADSGDDLPVTIRQLLDVASEILVVTPALPGRFEWLASATDRSREEADKRLQAVLGQLEEVEAETAGDRGMQDDPLEADSGCGSLSSPPTTC